MFALNDPVFESSVNSYGRQTCAERISKSLAFESSVNSYGRQTVVKGYIPKEAFESSVNSYGRQTSLNVTSLFNGLRVV